MQVMPTPIRQGGSRQGSVHHRAVGCTQGHPQVSGHQADREVGGLGMYGFRVFILTVYTASVYSVGMYSFRMHILTVYTASVYIVGM